MDPNFRRIALTISFSICGVAIPLITAYLYLKTVVQLMRNKSMPPYKTMVTVQCVVGLGFQVLIISSAIVIALNQGGDVQILFGVRVYTIFISCNDWSLMADQFLINILNLWRLSIFRKISSYKLLVPYIGCLSIILFIYMIIVVTSIITGTYEKLKTTVFDIIWTWFVTLTCFFSLVLSLYSYVSLKILFKNVVMSSKTKQSQKKLSTGLLLQIIIQPLTVFVVSVCTAWDVTNIFYLYFVLIILFYIISFNPLFNVLLIRYSASGFLSKNQSVPTKEAVQRSSTTLHPESLVAKCE